jgi:hypothetical protein
MFRVMLLSFLMIFVSCNSKDEAPPRQGDKVVRVGTDGVFDPLIVQRDSDSHIGDFLIGDIPRVITYTLINQSRYELTGLKFLIDDIETAGITFVKDAEGSNLYPGTGGTCSSTLKSNASCTVRIIYEPTIPGFFTQKITVKYTNLVNAEVLTDSLTALAGNPASLVFTNDITRYDLGIVERTFPDDRYYQELIVENRGGLPARNLNVVIENIPDTGAYRIIENDCPETLGLLQGCRVLVEFSAMNYGPGAPDGDQDRLSYNTTIRFDYERDSNGTLAALNGRISILSTSIQAQMERGGVGEIIYPELIVGNLFNRQIRFLNTGFKEAILHSIDFRNSDGTALATCVLFADGDESLSCHQAGVPISESSRLPLNLLPFRVTDINNCLTPVGDLGYISNSEGGLRQVSGFTPEGPGETCRFNVTFHPSVEFTSDGAWGGLSIDLSYDSTWKDNIVMRTTTEDPDFGFRIAEAPYRSAGTLTNFRLRLDGNILTPTEPEPRTFQYNLGRLTLISDTSFRTNVDFSYRNLGGSEVEVVQIVDGKGRNITDQNQMLDPYYRNANHESCNVLGRNGDWNMYCSLTNHSPCFNFS